MRAVGLFDVAQQVPRVGTVVGMAKTREAPDAQ